MSRWMPGRAYARPTSPLAQRLRRISALERREEAHSFLEAFHRESGATATALRRRWAEASRQLRRTGIYVHSPEELGFGARLAWRGQGRCIGRLGWDTLDVYDCRALIEPDAIADRIGRHMVEALGDGRIRSVISIFAPVTPSDLPAYVESGQITDYAGHVQPDGTIFGDRRNVEATRTCRALGWTPPDGLGRFDRLPLLIRDRRDRRAMFTMPPDAVREVPIVHPHHEAIRVMGLRWHAVPCVSDMILTIGGIDYPCAPFNGYYMSTEIASRNFADRMRYDLLPEAAEALGLNRAQPLWRDVALTELNRAVLHSYRAAGVTMIDHHTASDQFMTFHHREHSCGRDVAADWRWIVPPQASAGCEVFHLRMRNFHPVPNFYRSRASDGMRLMPFHGDGDRSRWQRNLDRVVRRWKLWKRMAW